MNDIAMSPTVMKAIPSPRRPAGTLLYLQRSRTAARSTIASPQPAPLPKPYQTLCAKL